MTTPHAPYCDRRASRACTGTRPTMVEWFHSGADRAETP